jgi:hypothetical protein
VAILGTLAVSLLAKTSQFTAALTGAQKRVSAFGKNVASLGAVSGKLNAVIGAVGGATLARFGLRALSSIERTDDLSRALGLSFQQFKALQFAADQAGTPLANLEAGFKKFQIQLGRAALGEKEAADGFKSIGLSVAELVKLDPISAFARLVDVLSRSGTHFQIVGKASKIFGRSTVDLIPLLTTTRGGFEGLIASGMRMTSVLEDGVGVIATLADRIGELRFQTETLGTSFLKTFSPVLIQSAEELSRVLSGTAEKSFGQSFGQIATGAVDLLVDGLHALEFVGVSALSAVTAGVQGLERGLNAVTLGLTDALEQAAELGAGPQTSPQEFLGRIQSALSNEREFLRGAVPSRLLEQERGQIRQRSISPPPRSPTFSPLGVDEVDGSPLSSTRRAGDLLNSIVGELRGLRRDVSLNAGLA